MIELSRQRLKPPAAKLNEQKVREIRASREDTYKLARRYGVDARTIELARSGGHWGHVT